MGALAARWRCSIDTLGYELNRLLDGYDLCMKLHEVLNFLVTGGASYGKVTPSQYTKVLQN